MLSQTCRYAIRALAFMATMPEQLQDVGSMAKTLDIPANYLSKILGQLSKLRLLESRKGRGGGYRLARDPSTIFLRDIVLPIDGTERSARCAFGLPECSDDDPCPLHEQWKQVKEGFENMLSTRTLADIAAHSGDRSGPQNGL